MKGLEICIKATSNGVLYNVPTPSDVLVVEYVKVRFSFGRSVIQIYFKAPLLSYYINLLKPTGHVMHQQFNIQQFYILPTLYLCVLYLSENKQKLVPLTA